MNPSIPASMLVEYTWHPLQSLYYSKQLILLITEYELIIALGVINPLLHNTINHNTFTHEDRSVEGRIKVGLQLRYKWNLGCTSLPACKLHEEWMNKYTRFWSLDNPDYFNALKQYILLLHNILGKHYRSTMFDF